MSNHIYDHSRRTGRTTRMLLEAWEYAWATGNDVLVIAANEEQSRNLISMFSNNRLPDAKTKIRRDTFKVHGNTWMPERRWRAWLRRLTFGRYFRVRFKPRGTIRFASMHDQMAWRGRSVRMFVDHYAIESGAHNIPSLVAYELRR